MFADVIRHDAVVRLAVNHACLPQSSLVRELIRSFPAREMEEVRLSPLSSLEQVTGSTRKSLIRQENVTQGIQRTLPLIHCVSVGSLGEPWLGLHPGAEDMPGLGSSVFTRPAAPSWHRSYATDARPWRGPGGQVALDSRKGFQVATPLSPVN